MLEFRMADQPLIATIVGEDDSYISYNIFFDKSDNTWRVFIQETISKNMPDLQAALDLCKKHSDRVNKRLANDTEIEIS